MNNILAYNQAIKDGSAPVGKWVRLWYDQLLEGLEAGRYFFDAKKAARAIRFVESFCHHHEGPKAPGLVRLELWQKAFLSVVFGIVDADGLRQFREVVLVMGRKNGKTLLAAAVAEYMAFLDGEYGGRIYFAAAKQKQAALCFDAFYQMIQQEPELDRMARKRRTDIYIDATNTSAQPLTFAADTANGLNISCGICDELASWHGERGLRFYEVLKSSMGARPQPLLLSITTSGYENEGIYDELMKRATRVVLGDSKETRLAPFLYMIDDVGKWNDINELAKANPNLGVSVPVNYLLDEIAIAEGSLSKRSEFITKYGCLKQNSATAWLPAEVVAKASGEHLEPEAFRGSYCVGGIDLSQTTDLTAACVVVEKGGRLFVLSKFWLPAEKIEEATERDGVPYDIYIRRGLLEPSGDNFVDYKDVFNWCRELVEEFEILPLKVGYDRYSAQYLIQDMKAYGFQVDDVYQGDNLWPVIQEVDGILRDGVLNIGDNDLLKVHMLDSAVKVSTERGRGKLVKVRPSAHIDGMAALLDAMTVRQKWFGEIGGQLANE